MFSLAKDSAKGHDEFCFLFFLLSKKTQEDFFNLLTPTRTDDLLHISLAPLLPLSIDDDFNVTIL